jgi:hypothetical protein
MTQLARQGTTANINRRIAGTADVLGSRCGDNATMAEPR